MLPDLLSKLQSPKSSLRKSAAKKIRKTKDSNACQPLVQALYKEVQNKKTWELQYHMVMAIGQSNCKCSLKDLYGILEENNLDPMVKIAMADSIVTLEKTPSFLFKALDARDISLVEGSLRAFAFNQIKIPHQLVDELINFTLSYKNHLTYFWIAASAPGCDSDNLKSYLKKWIYSDNEDVSKAAKAALENKYLKWSIL